MVCFLSFQAKHHTTVTQTALAQPTMLHMGHIALDTRGHHSLPTVLKWTWLELFPGKETPTQTVSLNSLIRFIKHVSSKTTNLVRRANFMSQCPILYHCTYILIHHPLDSPNTGHKVSTWHGFPCAQLVGSCSFRSL